MFTKYLTTTMLVLLIVNDLAVAKQDMQDQFIMSSAEHVLRESLSLGGFEIVLVLGNQKTVMSRHLTQMLSESGLMYSSATPDGTQNLVSHSCNATAYRTDHTARAKLVFTISENAQEFIEVSQNLEDTATVCKDLIHPGLYHPDNVIIHFLTNRENLTLSDTIFDGHWSRRHRRVLGFQPYRSGLVRMTRYNIYQDQVVSQLDSLEASLARSKSWFQDFGMKGYTFRVGTMIFEVYVIGSQVPNATDPLKKINVTGGLEIDMAKLVCKALDCKLSFSNSLDMEWGDNLGEPTGLIREIYDDRADIIMCAVGAHFYNLQVMRFAGNFDKGIFTIVTPIPKPKRSMFAFLHPAKLSVWLALLGSVVTMTILLFSFAKGEEAINGKSLFWSDLPTAGWYVFSTLIGENITHQTNFDNAQAVRFLCIIWMLAAMILTAAYSGTLNATLVLPIVPAPIDTLEQLARSELSWNLVQYFHPIEKDLETSDDPAKRRIWEKKELVPYETWPYERMKRVYDGESAMLEWKTFDTLMEAAFMLPNGQPLVHVSKTVNLSPGVYSTWGFAKNNPWIERFLLQIGNIVEAGIDHKIRKDNRKFLKMESLHLLEGVTTPVQALIRGEGEEDVNVMTLEDYLGIFSFYLCCIGANLLLFSWEFLNKYPKRTTILMITIQKLKSRLPVKTQTFYKLRILKEGSRKKPVIIFQKRKVETNF